MTVTVLKVAYNHSVYPRDSKTNTNKRFVKNVNGSMGRSHWTCFYIKDNKSHYFDSFGGSSDTFYFNNHHIQLIFIFSKFNLSIVFHAVFIAFNSSI